MQKRNSFMGIKKGLYLIVLFAVAFIAASCGKIWEPPTGGSPLGGQPPGVHMPGTIKGGIYLSPAGNFTVNADERLWTVKEDGEQTLHLKENDNVWISFSAAEGLTPAMLEDFEESFVERYIEGVRVTYPDAEMRECEVINSSLVRVDMSMSYGSGLYTMYQIMYLVSDGENGYIITAILPQSESEHLRTSVYDMVETIQFLNASDEVKAQMMQ